jgi:hypothetical protein
VCGGICTGDCDSVAYPFDASVPEAGEAGATEGGTEGGAAEGGAMDAGGPVADAGSGTCNGVCRGKCSKEASGSCTARCTGDFAGTCAAAGNCVGTCNGVGVPCVTTCNGSCQTANAQCTGTCTDCSAPFQNPECTGTFSCGEPNPICAAVCGVKGGLAAKCPAVAFDVRVAGDYALDLPLKAHMADFSQASQELATIVNTQGGVADRTVGDFRAIGVIYDNARLCAIGGQPLYEEARKNLNEAVGASLVIRGTKF